MNETELDEAPTETREVNASDSGAAEVQRLISWQPGCDAIFGVRVGTLVGIAGNGQTPLVVFSGQPGTAAVSARATVDLHGAHVGRDVVLMFEDGDPRQPIVMGCITSASGCPAGKGPGQVEVDADGERMLVSAKDQLVLRCGEAAITLTKSGKIIIQGTYVSSYSSGVVRIKGGSIQLN